MITLTAHSDIQASLTKASLRGQAVFIPSGVSVHAPKPLKIPSNTHLLGGGPTSKLYVRPGIDIVGLGISGGHDIRIEKMQILPEGADGKDYLTMPEEEAVGYTIFVRGNAANIVLNELDLSYSSRACFFGVNAGLVRQLRLSSLFVHDCLGTGLGTAQSKDMQYKDIRLLRCGRPGRRSAPWAIYGSRRVECALFENIIVEDCFGGVKLTQAKDTVLRHLRVSDLSENEALVLESTEGVLADDFRSSGQGINVVISDGTEFRSCVVDLSGVTDFIGGFNFKGKTINCLLSKVRVICSDSANGIEIKSEVQNFTLSDSTIEGGKTHLRLWATKERRRIFRITDNIFSGASVAALDLKDITNPIIRNNHFVDCPGDRVILGAGTSQGEVTDNVAIGPSACAINLYGKQHRVKGNKGMPTVVREGTGTHAVDS